MKKAIALLLAAAGVLSAADPFLNLTQGNVKENEYAVSGIINHQYTAALTLNLDVMAQTPGISPIFALGGTTADAGIYGAEIIAFDNGGIDYKTQRKDTLENAFTSSNYQYTWKDVSTEYTSLKETPNWGEAKSAAFVLVGDSYSNTQDKFTGYLFVLNNDDSVSSYAGYQYWTFKTNINTLKIYTESIDSFQLYTESMNATGAEALAMSMMLASSPSTPGTDNTIPEPTTATLSLLALAGLAARRRRR